MAVGFILEFPGGTLEQYDQVIEKMQLGGKTASGGQFHAAGQTADGIRVVDVWDSDEAFQKFADEQIGPITQEMGLPEPKITRIEEHRIGDLRGERGDITFFQVIHLDVDADTFDEADQEIRGGIDQWPDGIVFHIAGPSNGEWIVADGWTSKEVRDRFMEERVGPAMGRRGLAPPTIDEMSVHNTLAPG
jgi:hypothetical protein